MFKNLWGRFYNRFLKPRMDVDDLLSPIPESTPTPTPTPSPTPTPTPFYGRSRGVRQLRELYPNRYKKFITKLSSLNPNRLEGDFLTDLAFSESSLIHSKRNRAGSTATGLFQFTDPTWSDYLEASGAARLAGHSRIVPEHSIQAALYTLRKGIKGQGLRKWEASRPKWGRYYTPAELEEFYY